MRSRWASVALLLASVSVPAASAADLSGAHAVEAPDTPSEAALADPAGGASAQVDAGLALGGGGPEVGVRSCSFPAGADQGRLWVCANGNKQYLSCRANVCPFDFKLHVS